MLLLQLALEKEANSHMNAYRPGGHSGGYGKGSQNTQRRVNSKNARLMSTLFWCEAVDAHGTPVHSHDCEGHQGFQSARNHPPPPPPRPPSTLPPQPPPPTLPPHPPGERKGHTVMYRAMAHYARRRGQPPHPPSITRLLWWLQTAFCVHRLVCAPQSL